MHRWPRVRITRAGGDSSRDIECPAGCSQCDQRFDAGSGVRRLCGLGFLAVAGHRTERAGYHVERGHAEPPDDRDRGGVVLVDLGQYLGQAEVDEGVLQYGAGSLGGVALAPRAGSQAVEDLQPEVIERPQSGRADQSRPVLDEPDAVPALVEILGALLDGFRDLGCGQRLAVEEEPPYIRQGPVGQQHGMILRCYRPQDQAFRGQDVVHARQTTHPVPARGLFVHRWPGDMLKGYHGFASLLHNRSFHMPVREAGPCWLAFVGLCPGVAADIPPRSLSASNGSASPPTGATTEALARSSSTGASTAPSAAGFVSTYAVALSLGLQHQVPLADLIRPGLDQFFVPNGHTDDPEIPRVRSAVDYIARRLAIDWLP